MKLIYCKLLKEQIVEWEILKHICNICIYRVLIFDRNCQRLLSLYGYVFLNIIKEQWFILTVFYLVRQVCIVVYAYFKLWIQEITQKIS